MSPPDSAPLETLSLADLREFVGTLVAKVADLGAANATTSHATSLTLISSALLERVEIIERRGTCHQLANDDRLTWVPDCG
ncbi:ABC-three component system protein [Paracraurococcus lichenis]|uniref:ABC-three component systems C-terminal domain-containing protein n=1 Tax=Paracraurococcus lichenis TaxID=3064888 RepID=A0ABT9EDX4_9PROT|nr:ABC-three component system protein [Paracraurococcus sp. LOR1-02]MDO9714173.1 hypothetical protein [Paracraurococcus sp. LOR1-02]